MTPRFEIRQGRRRLGQRRWYVVLVASNGEILCSSEQLNSSRAAWDNVAATMTAAKTADIVDTSRG